MDKTCTGGHRQGSHVCTALGSVPGTTSPAFFDEYSLRINHAPRLHAVLHAVPAVPVVHVLLPPAPPLHMWRQRLQTAPRRLRTRKPHGQPSEHLRPCIGNSMVTMIKHEHLPVCSMHAMRSCVCEQMLCCHPHVDTTNRLYSITVHNLPAS